MWFLLWKKFFADALKLLFNPSHLLPRCGALLWIQLQCLWAGKPPMGTVDNRGDHLQIADQFSAGPWRDFLLPLRFEKQRGIVQNAFADDGRSPAPGGIQLPRFARIAVMLGKDRRDALAILQALARYRHQKLHRRLRRDLPSRTCCWMASGKSSTNASRRKTHVTLRSNRLANSSKL